MLFNGLDFHLNEAIKELKEYDINIDKKFVQQHWELPSNYNIFTFQSKEALLFLVTGERYFHDTFDDKLHRHKFSNPLNVVDALKEISGLNHYELSVLTRLYVYGVRVEHLRQISGYNFFSDDLALFRCEILIGLVSRCANSFDQAIEKISVLGKERVFSGYEELKKYINENNLPLTHLSADLDLSQRVSSLTL